MTNHCIERVTEEHIVELTETLIKTDKDACWALCRWTPEEAVRKSLETSFDTGVWLVDGKVASMYGFSCPTLYGATVWLLGTDLIKQYPKTFLKGTKSWVQAGVKTYGRLSNLVDARATDSIRWIKWLGATIHPPVSMGVDQLPFHVWEIK